MPITGIAVTSRGVEYARTVIAYHGCDLKVARRLVDGAAFRESRNVYDWLGPGVYFWEHGPDRAYRFAQDQQARGKVKTPAVVGAVIQLGRCFDLLDTRFTADLADGHALFRRAMRKGGLPLPKNAGRTPDRLLRNLDCAVFTWYLDQLTLAGRYYDTVRACFLEGKAVYPGAGLRRESHLQICVRTPDCILGTFRPRI